VGIHGELVGVCGDQRAELPICKVTDFFA
jgi:hypothetical protein